MKASPRAPASEPELISGDQPAAAGGAIEVAAARHSYGETQVLDGLELRAGEHEVVGVVGPSGCGKSTLLEAIAGLRRLERGEISVGGAGAPEERLRRCAYMPQRDLLLPWLSALDNAALAPRNRGLGRRRARALARPLFERFGLAQFAEARPHELSGGMRQRVAFLRTLLAGKPALLLDEPFAALDAITRAEMQSWLAAALTQEPRTVLLVSHDVEEALYLCDRVVILSRRPARALEELRPPAPRHPDRAAAVSAPEFSALRERALAALRGGAR